MSIYEEFIDEFRYMIKKAEDNIEPDQFNGDSYYNDTIPSTPNAETIDSVTNLTNPKEEVVIKKIHNKDKNVKHKKEHGHEHEVKAKPPTESHIDDDSSSLISTTDDLSSKTAAGVDTIFSGNELYKLAFFIGMDDAAGISKDAAGYKPTLGARISTGLKNLPGQIMYHLKGGGAPTFKSTAKKVRDTAKKSLAADAAKKGETSLVGHAKNIISKNPLLGVGAVGAAGLGIGAALAARHKHNNNPPPPPPQSPLMQSFPSKSAFMLGLSEKLAGEGEGILEAAKGIFEKAVPKITKWTKKNPLKAIGVGAAGGAALGGIATKTLSHNNNNNE